MARVGDLLAAIRTPRRPEERLLRTGTSPGLAAAEKRRPVGRAGSGAGAATVLVLLEQVERAALAVDQDAAERRARDADLGRAGAAIRDVRLDRSSIRRRGIR